MSKIAIAFAAALLVSGGAAAHALLERAVPAVGSTVPHAPAVLTLTFSEGVEAAFCKVAVTSGAGGSFADGAARNAPSNKRVLMLHLKPLPSGQYTVSWQAVSVDTHHTEGTFHFTVGGAGAS